MKYIPYPPTCGVDIVEVDKANNKSTLIIIDPAQVSNDLDDPPLMKDKKLEIKTIQPDEIILAIEQTTGVRPLRLDPS
jgi:hypothetical protein